jgi:hypothetical protein
MWLPCGSCGMDHEINEHGQMDPCPNPRKETRVQKRRARGELAFIIASIVGLLVALTGFFVEIYQRAHGP